MYEKDEVLFSPSTVELSVMLRCVRCDVLSLSCPAANRKETGSTDDDDDHDIERRPMEEI